MKTHLDSDDFVGALEQPPQGAVARHLASCAQCRAELEGLEQSWQELAGADVPEPSPLFWDHFPARVGRALDEAEPETSRTQSWWGGRLTWAVGAMALVLALAGTFVWAPDSSQSPESMAALDGMGGTVQFDDVADLFAELATDDALAFAPAGTATWALVDELTVEERTAFVRLVEHELEAMP